MLKTICNIFLDILVCCELMISQLIWCVWGASQFANGYELYIIYYNIYYNMYILHYMLLHYITLYYIISYYIILNYIKLY